MNALTSARSPRTGRLYLICLAWGLATGATTGAVVGAALLSGSGLGDRTVGSRLGLSMVGGLYGTVVGTLVAILPSAVGGLVVTGAVRRFSSATPSPVLRRHLGWSFVALATFLNGGLLLAIFAGGDGASSVTRSLPYIAIANFPAALMLYLAAGSITRASAKHTAPQDLEVQTEAPRSRAWY